MRSTEKQNVEPTLNTNIEFQIFEGTYAWLLHSEFEMFFLQVENI